MNLLPRSVTTPMRTVIIIVVVIVVLVAVRLERTLSSPWFWVCPCSLCLLHLTMSNVATRGHTLDGIQ